MCYLKGDLLHLIDGILFRRRAPGACNVPTVWLAAWSSPRAPLPAAATLLLTALANTQRLLGPADHGPHSTQADHGDLVTLQCLVDSDFPPVALGGCHSR